jgi:hypothetical protein
MPFSCGRKKTREVCPGKLVRDVLHEGWPAGPNGAPGPVRQGLTDQLWVTC